MDVSDLLAITLKRKIEKNKGSQMGHTKKKIFKYINFQDVQLVQSNLLRNAVLHSSIRIKIIFRCKVQTIYNKRFFNS
jgi:hypothetical protein